MDYQIQFQLSTSKLSNFLVSYSLLMTSRRRNSNDTQDDLSTDTNLSSASELFLARIQEETNRIRKKRKGRKDSKSKISNHHHDDDHPKSLTKQQPISTRQQQQEQTSNLSKDIDQSFKSSPSTNTRNKPHLVVHSNTESTLPNKVESAPPKPKSQQRHQLSQALSSEFEDPSSEFYFLAQRGDSIAQSNEFENSSATPNKPAATSTTSYWTKKNKMASPQELQQKEAFQKKLIDEVLGKDAGDKVSMEKVMMILWQFRDDKDVIKFMTRFVCKVGICNAL